VFNFRHILEDFAVFPSWSDAPTLVKNVRILDITFNSESPKVYRLVKLLIELIYPPRSFDSRLEFIEPSF
jgi:hypothetical protein